MESQRPRGSMALSAMLAVLLAAPAIAGEPATHEQVEAEPWTLGASLFWYLAPGQKNFWVLNASADHGPVHIELRYHDEALGTASALLGWNLEWGDRLKFGLTPSMGSLIGTEGGPIFGLDIALSWGPLSFSSQQELIWVIQGGDGWFFYAWTELDVRPWPWLRAGVVAERTRLFHTARQWIFGPLVGFTVWKVDVSLYWFQPGGVDQTFAAKLEVTF